MLPQSDFDPPMLASVQAPVAIAALTQDRALIGLLRSTIDPTHDLILVTSEAELTPHLNSRRVSACLLDSMFIEGDLAAMSERLRGTWPDLVLVVVGTAEEQSKVASQITSGVVYRFLHRPVSAPRVRLFVEAALRRHEVENVERTLEQVRPDFSRFETTNAETTDGGRGRLLGIAAVAAAVVVVGGAWYALSSGEDDAPRAAQVSEPSQSRPAQEDRVPAETSAARENAPSTAAPPPAPAPDARSNPAAAREPAAVPPAAAPEESVAERLRQPASSPVSPPASVPAAPVSTPARATTPVRVPDESTQQTTPAPVLTFEQRLRDQLERAESALQRGELASPAGRNAVELFSGALAMDATNTLAKAGLVRVADRLLSAAERALTAGNPEDAKSMVDVAEKLTPATARGAFLMMQIEMEHERAALTRKQDSDAKDNAEKGATYLRLANARLKSGALIEPAEDNARFYLEAARQTVPEDPSVSEVSRALQKELLTRASAAAGAGNAAETERWLANADGAGAPRPELANIRRSLQDTLIGERAGKVTALTQSFTTALNANRLLDPAADSAKQHLLALIGTDASNPVVATARQGLGNAYLREMRAALARNDVTAADVWKNEARIIGFASAELVAAETELAATRERIAQQDSVVGERTLQRIEYVAPKVPSYARERGMTGWVELEYTVRTDGSTGDIVVTNSSPRRTFDAAARTAVAQWRYKPVMRGDKAIEQRAAVRIRFTEE